METKIKYLNTFSCCGRLLSAYKNKKDDYILNVLLHENGRKKQLHITYSGELDFDVSRKPYVDIVGTLVAYRNTNNGKYVGRTQYFVATNVKEQKTPMEKVFGRAGEFNSGRDKFIGCISGTVVKVLESGDYANLIVKTSGPFSACFVKVSTRKDRLPKTVSYGSDINMLYRVDVKKSTPKEGEKPVYYEDLYLTDISIASESENASTEENSEQ